MNHRRPIVSGGATSIDAVFQDMRTHADHLDRCGDDARGFAAEVVRLAAGLPDKAVILAPTTGFAVAGQVLGLTLGPDSLTVLVGRLEVLARGLRLAATVYEQSEGSARTAFELVQLPIHTALFVGVAASELAKPGTPVQRIHRLVTSFHRNPHLIDWGVSVVWRALPGEPLPFEKQVGLIVLAGRGIRLFHDPKPLMVKQVQALGTAHPPVRNLGGLMETQQQILSTPKTTKDGTRIRAQRVLGTDGTHRWIVSVPGTQAWSPNNPENPSDLETNLEAIAGMETEIYPAIASALTLAMRQAGVKPGQERVMMAGHSQGGLVATRLAADPEFKNKFNVSAVVTAGSPVSRIEVPRDVRTLNIEHHRDPVPRLDARHDANRSNHLRVVMNESAIPGKTPSIATSHHAMTYAGSAREQLSPHDPNLDPQLRRWYTEHGDYLNGKSAQSYEVLIRRPQ